MYPIKQSITGTTAGTAIFPDIYQNPFNMGIAVQLVTGGVSTAGVSIEGCNDYRLVYAPSWNGNTGLLDGATATAVWFPCVMNASTVTATVGTSFAVAVFNYTTPIAALRCNVYSASATTVVIVEFIQSSNAP